MQELEQQSFAADVLQEITSKAEQTEDPFGAVLDSDGSLRIRRATQRIELPADSEALRRRVHVLGFSWDLARLKSLEVAWLQTQPWIWDEHLNFILGGRVHGLRIRGGRDLRPRWRTALGYEYVARKEAIRQVLYNGADFVVSQRTAQTHSELRDVQWGRTLHTSTQTKRPRRRPPRAAPSSEFATTPAVARPPASPQRARRPRLPWALPAAHGC